MKLNELRDLDDARLVQRLDEIYQELFNLRFQIATRKLKNHQRVRAVKRDVARLLTVVREREIEALYAAEIAELQALVGGLSSPSGAAR